MLFSTLILVTVDGKHDRLQQRVNLGHGNEPAQVGNVPGLGLQKEQQISVFLCLIVVGECALLHFGSILKVASNFILLESLLAKLRRRARGHVHTSSRAMRF